MHFQHWSTNQIWSISKKQQTSYLQISIRRGIFTSREHVITGVVTPNPSYVYLRIAFTGVYITGYSLRTAV